MDITAIDTAGRTLMTSAAALRKQFADADKVLGQLVEGWTDPAAATVSADWDAVRATAGRWLDHMHGLGSLVRSGSASTAEVETAAASLFRRGPASAELAEELQHSRAAGSDSVIDPAVTDQGEGDQA
ncbi:hypothetical protein [Nocardia vaccinii]|uniref:hypothetical protein n=1 Tax=Nocardia vaccinii TaxID=1822 RepID=UPI0008306AC3|nr:hypothetical protein [Nocardia vaccinii]